VASQAHETSARRRLPVDERRAMLLELGLRLFGARGLDEVSVEDIAREAGVSAGLLYHYFGSKREFHHEVTAHALERLTAVTAPDPARPPGERLVTGLVAYLEYLRADTTGWSWLLRGGGSGDERTRANGEAYRRTIETWVFDALPGAARKPLTRVAVRGWIGSNTEMALAWLDAGEPGHPEVADVVRLMVAVLVAALGAAGVDDAVVRALTEQAGAALAAETARAGRAAHSEPR
jgi:AcrR family transcriptional regulator